MWGSMYDDVFLRAVPSYTCAPDNLCSRDVLSQCPSISSSAFLSSSLALLFPPPSFLHNPPPFSHAHTISTSFPEVSLRFSHFRCQFLSCQLFLLLTTTYMMELAFLQNPTSFPVPSLPTMSLPRTPVLVLPLSCTLQLWLGLHLHLFVTQHSSYYPPVIPC